jgi:hypothetical protein
MEQDDRRPPTRTKMRVPFVEIVSLLKPGGNGWT